MDGVCNVARLDEGNVVHEETAVYDVPDVTVVDEVTGDKGKTIRAMSKMSSRIIC